MTLFFHYQSSMKEMGLLSSPLVKILGGHGVICYYCFLFFVSNHPSELETELDLAEVHSGGPSRSPQVSLPFCFIGHKVKNKTIPFQLFDLLVFVPALGVPEEMPEQEPHLWEEGTVPPGSYWVCQPCSGQVQPTRRRLWSKKSSFKSQLLCLFFFSFTTVFIS